MYSSVNPLISSVLLNEYTAGESYIHLIKETFINL